MLGTLAVSEIGIGTMSFASTYGEAPDRDEAIRVIRGAHKRGVTFFDTAEAYARGRMKNWSARPSRRWATRS